MADLKAQIEINADARGVETGVGRAKKSIATLGTAAATTGKDASQSFSRIGTASESASRSIDRSVARLRVQAATIGKSAVDAKLFELAQRGASRAQLDSARTALEAVAAQKAQADAVARTQAAFTTARASVARYAAVLTGLATAGGIALAAMGRSSINAIDAFNDLSDATGASIENISALDRVARETGGGFDTVSSTLIKFNQVLSKTDEEGQEAARVLKALGLNSEQLRNADPAEALRQTAAALSKFANDGNKARAVQVLFGKSIREAAPFLRDLADKTELVAVTSGRAAADAESFNKKLFEMRANADDATRIIATKLLPTVSALADELLVGLKNSTGFFDALATFGTINPFRTQAGNMKALREELSGLEEDRKRFLKSGSDTRSIDDAITFARRQLDYLKELEARRALANTGDTSDFFSRRLAGGGEPVRSLEIAQKPAERSPVRRAVAADPLAEAKRYLEGLQQQLDATKNLTASEQLLQDLRSNRLGPVSPALREALTTAAQQVDVAREQVRLKEEEARASDKALAAQERLDEAARASVVQAAEQNQSMRDEIELLGLDGRAIVAVEKARLSSAVALKEEELARLRNTTASTVQIESLAREIDLLRERSGLLSQRQERTEVIEGLEQARASADLLKQDLAGAFQAAFQSADNPLQAFGESLYRTISNRVSAALAESLADSLLGAFGSAGGGGGGDFVSSLIGAVLGGRALGGPVSAGSAYRINERGAPEIATLGGKDYLLTGAQGGKVKPATVGQQQSLSVVNNFAISGPVDRRTQDQIASQAGLAIQRALARGTA